MEHSKKRILLTTIIGGILFVIGLSLFLVGLTIKRPVVTYYDGNEVISTEKVAIGKIGGQGYIPTKISEKKGYVYTFQGWHVDYTDELVREIEVTEDRPYKATAEFTLGVYKYTIKYNLNDGAFSEGTKVNYSYTVEDGAYKLPTPVKVGYKFVGWYLNKNFTEKVDKVVKELVEPIDLNKEKPESLNVYAKWELINYTISYNLDGGTNDSTNPTTYTVKSEMITLKDPSKEGFVFNGWYDSLGSIVRVIPQGSTGNKEFLAYWVKPITYHLNGGSNSSDAPTTYELGSTVELVEPTRFGYNFKGWYLNETFEGDAVTILTDIDNVDVHLYAKWEKIEEDLVFKENGIEYIYFGSYPQTVVSDAELITKLEKVCENKTSCVYEGTEYIKLTATPTNSSVFNSLVMSNNKIEAKTYFFKVEPIKWRVLSNKDGKLELLCEFAIDASIFGSKQKVNNETSYANNYENSDIRKWLNGEFLSTAFTNDELKYIQQTLVDNSEASTFTETRNEYACNNTNDKVYLLSFKEATKVNYGFNSSRDEQDEMKGCYSTDYARAKGVQMNVSNEYFGYVNWMLRSPFYNDEKGIAGGVGIENGQNKVNTIAWFDATTILGVRPAITIVME